MWEQGRRGRESGRAEEREGEEKEVVEKIGEERSKEKGRGKKGKGEESRGELLHKESCPRVVKGTFSLFKLVCVRVCECLGLCVCARVLNRTSVFAQAPGPWGVLNGTERQGGLFHLLSDCCNLGLRLV